MYHIWDIHTHTYLQTITYFVFFSQLLSLKPLFYRNFIKWMYVAIKLFDEILYSQREIICIPVKMSIPKWFVSIKNNNQLNWKRLLVMIMPDCMQINLGL